MTNNHIPLAQFRFLERTSPTTPALPDVQDSVCRAIVASGLGGDHLRDRTIAIAAGSRGIASVREVVRAVSGWLKSQAAHPFVFPAMGSHGGATAEGQRRILEQYGVTPEYVGCDVKSSMESVPLGNTPEGFQVFMDRNAWESDGVFLVNRVKPHTDFSGTIESGLLKMMAVGMEKVEGARECHRWSWKHGFETVIRAMAGHVISTGKIVGGIALVENELHQLCGLHVLRADEIPRVEPAILAAARRLVPRIPFANLHLLIVDELGKNISGTGMDTRTIGRGVPLQPGEAPQIDMIYVRDLTEPTAGNAVGIGLADVIHERLFRRIDFQKTYVNTRTSLNPAPARIPIHLPSDSEALALALGHLGTPEPEEQRIVWIRNTLELDRIAVSEPLVRAVGEGAGWHLSDRVYEPQFDAEANLVSPFEDKQAL